MGLYISVNSPGSELARSPIDEAILFVAAHAAMERRQGHTPAGPSLDLTFMLSGSQDIPPFSGMRMGGYNKEGDTLFFEAAVPAQMTRSPEAAHYVAMVMQDMVANAHDFFREHSISFNLTQWRTFVDTIGKLEADRNVFQ